MKISTTTIWTKKHYKLVLFCIIQLILLTYFLGCNTTKKIPQKGNELVNKRGYHLEYGSDSTWGKFSIIVNNELFVGEYVTGASGIEEGQANLIYYKFKINEISDSMKIIVTLDLKVDVMGQKCENPNMIIISNANHNGIAPYQKLILNNNQNYYIIDYYNTDDMVRISYDPIRSIDIPNFFNLLRGKQVLFEYCFIHYLSTVSELESCDVYTSDLFYKFE